MEKKYKEETLYKIWQQQIFSRQLETFDGEAVTVLNCGTLNHNLPGPDFKNARVRIGNLIFVGDIEIDNAYSDWKAHGHNIDNKYSRIILHASLRNPNNYAYVYSRDGRKIPSLCLLNFLEKDLVDSLINEKEEEPKELSHFLKCHKLNEMLSEETKSEILCHLGLHRFENKCTRIFYRLKELVFLNRLKINEPVVSYDLTPEFQEYNFNYQDFSSQEIWQQLLYEMIFEALGYNKNKNQMLELAQHANLNFMSSILHDSMIIEKYESALFNISGLLSEQHSIMDSEGEKYIERLAINWDSISSNYDGKIMETNQWNFFRLRPQNFPTLRIAGGARIINEILNNNFIGKLAEIFLAIEDIETLGGTMDSLFMIETAYYWSNHYVFGNESKNEIKYFVGNGRANEIVVNVIFPFYSVYFEVFGNEEVSKKILRYYSNYLQVVDNYIITNVAESLNMTKQIKKTILTQGMLELFRSRCSKNKCLECEIGREVFN